MTPAGSDKSGYALRGAASPGLIDYAWGLVTVTTIGFTIVSLRLPNFHV
jgi:hypothetical protein